MTRTAQLTTEQTDLLTTLAKHRGFLRFTVQGLTDEQASATPTASALSLGGLVKHVRNVEESWMRFAVGGAELMESVENDWENGFRMVPGETLESLLADYEATARKTGELVAGLDMDTAHPLPVAPWFESGASWTVRRVLLHLIAETSQHAGHADILRETLDGQKTMG
ncbi:putative damage-inducible protein DinB [Saccharothrix tamanrassetensis]|uniref:Putative damage-inducible protein DinB n=1 Tax=Saccharothrix tamanrassetensis TaxID=1051531 RepID=A0A841CTX5_9PSEU|nr:DinB family protein [Saccharothrix tamanrassetensis]MBB5959477.1 putative damage-inducible protein DinB [Saccharothrix tamanrassetensis]